MYWYAARVIEFNGDRALVELDKHPGERASLLLSNLRCREVTPNGEVRGATQLHRGASAGMMG